MHPKAVIVEEIGAATAVVNGRTVDAFVLHDYLKLSQRPEVLAAASNAIAQFGLNVCAVPSRGGGTALHRRLEIELAAFLSKEDAVVFSGGLVATIAALQTLVRNAAASAISPDTVLVCYDECIPATVAEAARGLKITARDFDHNSLWGLKKSLLSRRIEQRIIVVGGVYEMEAQVAPLDKYVDEADKHKAIVLLDDAYGVGVIGDKLGGTADHYGVTKHSRLVISGSLGRVFGGAGGFVAGSADFCRDVRLFAPAYRLTQSLAPCMVGGALAALEILREEGRDLQERLRYNISIARMAFKEAGVGIQAAPALPCIMAMIGAADSAEKISRDMLQAGILISTLTWPSVPKDRARVHVVITIAHSREQITRMAGWLARSLAKHGLRLDPRRK